VSLQDPVIVTDLEYLVEPPVSTVPSASTSVLHLV